VSLYLLGSQAAGIRPSCDREWSQELGGGVPVQRPAAMADAGHLSSSFACGRPGRGAEGAGGCPEGHRCRRGKAGKAARHTFREVAERYIAEYAKIKNKPGTLREKERVIKVDLLPSWGHRKAADITRREVIALLDEVAARGARIHANRVLALVSSIFNWAVAKEIVLATPATRLEKPGLEQSRERVLEDEELRKVWRALESEPSAFGNIFRLLLLTGQRRSEVCEMPWSELDLNSGWWTIPGERTKNKLTHRVSLVGEALAILKSLEAANGDAEYVFVGKGGIRPIVGLGKSLKRIVDRSGVSFRVHDLRRTLSTNMGRLAGR
jgi:integrase